MFVVELNWLNFIFQILLSIVKTLIFIYNKYIHRYIEIFKLSLIFISITANFTFYSNGKL